MSIEEQARREAEERYPAARVMHFSGDGPVLDVGAVRLNREAYAAALISERSKERPWIHEIIAAAVESFDLGPEDQDAVMRFGMRLQDMEDAQPPFTVDELANEIRRVDGSNSLGAGALAEALMPFIAKAQPLTVDMEVLQQEIEAWLKTCGSPIPCHDNYMDDLRDRLTTLLNTSAAMAEVERCRAKG